MGSDVPIFFKNIEFGIRDVKLIYKKKLTKIYQTYIIALMIIFKLGYIDAIGFVKHLLTLTGWGAFWFMLVIIRFYAIAPLFLLLYTYVKRRRHSDLCFVLILFLEGIFPAVDFLYTKYTENSTFLFWYMPIFIIGMLLEEAYTKFADNKTTMVGDILVFIGTVIIILQAPFMRQLIWGIKPSSYLQNKYIYIILWGIIIWGVMRGTIWKNVLQNMKIARFVGTLSFQIYLLHCIFLTYLEINCLLGKE